MSFRIGGVSFPSRPVFLAPMEDVTDLSFRILCREQGADAVFTEFVNADGLARSCRRAKRKMDFLEAERPVAIQLYGSNEESMAESTRMATERNPDWIDINAGCWVKKVAHRGAGAGLLKNPNHFENLVREVVRSTHLPVTVKTRLGWDFESINILEVAKRIEDAGAKMLTLHCRTRSQGHNGEADWSWIARVKEVVSIPVILNGNLLTADDVHRAWQQTPADGFMVARGAIGRPWLFQEIRAQLNGTDPLKGITPHEIVRLCLRHLDLHVEQKGERVGIPSFRKFYAGYFKGIYGASKLRLQLVQLPTRNAVHEFLESFSFPEEPIVESSVGFPNALV